MNRDLGVTSALRETLPEWATELFVLVAFLGDLVVIVPVLGLVYLADVLSGLHRADTGSRARSSADGPLCSPRTAFVIAVIFGGLALVVAVKALFSLPRPPAELHAVEPSEYGFPSGHAMAATICWGALALWWPWDRDRGRLQRRLAVAAAILILVAFSRLALGVHYLPDVLVSALVGGVYLAAIGRLTRGRPAYAFGAAIGIAILAMLVSGGSTRALLALAGTIGAAIGWQTVEHPIVRRRLRGIVGR